jgi:hypothetical protein
MIESKFVADRGRALIDGCLHDTESELAPPVSGLMAALLSPLLRPNLMEAL